MTKKIGSSIHVYYDTPLEKNPAYATVYNIWLPGGVWHIYISKGIKRFDTINIDILFITKLVIKTKISF